MPKDDWKRAADRARYGPANPPDYTGKSRRKKRRRKQKAKDKAKPKAGARCPHCGKLLSEAPAAKPKSERKIDPANVLAWATSKMTEGAESGDRGRIEGPHHWACQHLTGELRLRLDAAYQEAVDLWASVKRGASMDPGGPEEREEAFAEARTMLADSDLGPVVVVQGARAGCKEAPF